MECRQPFQTIRTPPTLPTTVVAKIYSSTSSRHFVETCPCSTSVVSSKGSWSTCRRHLADNPSTCGRHLADTSSTFVVGPRSLVSVLEGLSQQMYRYHPPWRGPNPKIVRFRAWAMPEDRKNMDARGAHLCAMGSERTELDEIRSSQHVATRPSSPWHSRPSSPTTVCVV